mmetsp:Transcript_5649/g.4050  ORF Transcript_5649/g.4050 Transcript_5649/m.4050 type:complete len:216 (+) Transcript_5649:1196-1843(+)
MNEVPNTEGERAVITISGEELLLGSHVHLSGNVSIRNISTGCITSRPGWRVNLEEPKVTINVQSSHGGGLGNGPDKSTTVSRSNVHVLNTSPEVIESTKSEIVAAVLAPEVVDLDISGLAAETQSLSIVANIDIKIVLTGLKEKSVSAVRELTMDSWIMSTLFGPDFIDNSLGIRLSWSKDFDLVGIPGRRVGLSSRDGCGKHKIGEFHTVFWAF